jgi:la-related protein 1
MTEIFWLKGKLSPASELPANTSDEPYVNLRSKALEQRSFSSPPDVCQDMDRLYQFWSHFLVRNFNTRMYMEFASLAAQDFEERSSCAGRTAILNYYAGALAHQEPIRYIVAQDFVTLVQSEPRDSERSAFKQLRAAWRNGALNLKSRKRIMDFIDPALKVELDDKA